MDKPILIVDDNLNAIEVTEAVEKLKSNGIQLEAIEPEKSDSINPLIVSGDQLSDTAQEWYDRRLMKRLNRSKYKPHQGKQECARRVRQMSLTRDQRRAIKVQLRKEQRLLFEEQIKKAEEIALRYQSALQRLASE